jgi:hypothetical protein
MRDGEFSGEHIWLRQSVTFTHEGQTRTLEIALPVRPDAPPEEVARLLAQAEAGMAQLTLSLNQRVAEAQGAPQRSPATPIPLDVAPGGQTVAPHGAAPAPRATPPPQMAPQAEPRPEPEPETPEPATARRASPALPATPSAAAGPDLTLPEFISAIGELGLNPKEAMNRLEVRSLSGLNLREALETLRRQALHEGTAPMAPTAIHAPEEAMGNALPLGAGRFDEEDDDEAIVFLEKGADLEGEGEDTSAMPRSIPGTDRYGPDESDDLDDVPDFGPPPGSRARAVEPASSGARHASARPEQETTRAAQLIGKLRATHPGGIATADRQGAFANIIVAELGEPNATALVRGLWKLSPERLGPEQLDALIRWGKDESFAEEADEVLATLRAEQRARTAASQAAPTRSERSQPPTNAPRKRGES